MFEAHDSEGPGSDRKDWSFSTDDHAYEVIVAIHGISFVYAVKTTGIYRRTGCPSRRPMVKDVGSFYTPAGAEVEGYRACRRCRPNRTAAREQTAAKIAAAFSRIETAEEEPLLEALAAECGLSGP